LISGAARAAADNRLWEAFTTAAINALTTSQNVRSASYPSCIAASKALRMAAAFIQKLKITKNDTVDFSIIACICARS
jgi:hypothetical protein